MQRLMATWTLVWVSDSVQYCLEGGCGELLAGWMRRLMWSFDLGIWQMQRSVARGWISTSMLDGDRSSRYLE